MLRSFYVQRRLHEKFVQLLMLIVNFWKNHSFIDPILPLLLLSEFFDQSTWLTETERSIGYEKHPNTQEPDSCIRKSYYRFARHNSYLIYDNKQYPLNLEGERLESANNFSILIYLEKYHNKVWSIVFPYLISPQVKNVVSVSKLISIAYA